MHPNNWCIIAENVEVQAQSQLVVGLHQCPEPVVALFNGLGACFRDDPGNVALCNRSRTTLFCWWYQQQASSAQNKLNKRNDVELIFRQYRTGITGGHIPYSHSLWPYGQLVDGPMVNQYVALGPSARQNPIKRVGSDRIKQIED